MGKVQRMVGIPWHVEKMVREEGDDRRHRSRCIYYRGIHDGTCDYYHERCRGAAHCNPYKEQEICAESPRFMEKPIPKKTIEPFEGIRNIPIEDIEISCKFKGETPKEDKIKEVEKFIKENGCVDKPIVVTCNPNCYELQDKYLRYYVAKKLGLKEVSAEMGTEEEVKQYDKLRKRGSLVWIKKTAEIGEVLDANLEYVRIRLDSGEVKKYDIHKGVRSGAIRIL